MTLTSITSMSRRSPFRGPRQDCLTAISMMSAAARDQYSRDFQGRRVARRFSSWGQNRGVERPSIRCPTAARGQASDDRQRSYASRRPSSRDQKGSVERPRGGCPAAASDQCERVLQWCPVRRRHLSPRPAWPCRVKRPVENCLGPARGHERSDLQCCAAARRSFSRDQDHSVDRPTTVCPAAMSRQVGRDLQDIHARHRFSSQGHPEPVERPGGRCPAAAPGQTSRVIQAIIARRRIFFGDQVRDVIHARSVSERRGTSKCLTSTQTMSRAASF